VILVDWRESGFVPLDEHGTLDRERAYGEAARTALDLRPLRDGDGVAAHDKREKA
jgi:hypothetical protein